jgi:succinate dehydrogenase / fumarate reductase cytochrome b subunit
MKRRPINLNFLTIHFPVTAWVSIAHRLSGFFLFLIIPALLWMLQESLASESRFGDLKAILHTPLVYGCLWILLMALLYHLVAGIRHLLMDIHIGGESKKEGRISAWWVVSVSLILFVASGYWLWWK